MKKLILITLITFLTNFNSSFAQKAELNIAVIDAQEVLANSKVMEYIKDELAKKEKEYQTQINEKQKVLENEFKRIESKKSVLLQDALEKEEKNFAKNFGELKKELEEKKRSLNSASLQALNIVDKKVNEIITNISKEKEIDLILPASSVIFSKDELDISSEVLKRLNKQMKIVKIKFN